MGTTLDFSQMETKLSAPCLFCENPRVSRWVCATCPPPSYRDAVQVYFPNTKKVEPCLWCNQPLPKDARDLHYGHSSLTDWNGIICDVCFASLKETSSS